MGDIATSQWQANVYTRTFIDDNKDGVYQPSEGGVSLVNTTVRYRDGSLANNLVTDFNGVANFNETFPLFNWYVVETDTTRYKTTGIHTVYDAGGPADGSASCGRSGISGLRYLHHRQVHGQHRREDAAAGRTCCGTRCSLLLRMPTAPGCRFSNRTHSPAGSTIGAPPVASIHPWVPAEGWQGFSGQNNFIEFGKTPYVAG